MIEIRVVSGNDAGILNNVAADVFDHGIDPQATAAYLRDPRNRLAVAVEDNVVVGFVSAVHHVHPDKPRPELWINEVGVAPTHQGRGVGNALMRSILETARTAGCSEAWVLTDRSNIAAMRLYSSSGGAEPSDQVMYTFRLDDSA